MGRRKPPAAAEFLERLDGQFLDMEAENDALRKELRRVLALKGSLRHPKFRRYRVKKQSFRKYLIIPDTQVRPGVPVDHMAWIGKYIAEKRPDVIIHLGDHWDMPSLSSWQKPTQKAFSGLAYAEDVRAGNEAMETLTAQYRGIRGYEPEQHFIVGNHEHRIARFLEEMPWLRGFIGFENLTLDGWKVHPFLSVWETPEGVLVSHYFHSPNSSRPIGGTAHNLLNKVGKSCIQGHRQCLDSAVKYLPDGTQRRSLICGTCYLHEEDYRPQGNGEWRGIIVLNEVASPGTWDQMEVSLDYLRRKYG